MKFYDHRNLVGEHALLSPSKYYWLGYSDDKLAEWAGNCRAMQEGIDTHDFARRCIERGVKLPKRKKTLNRYVNDVIDHGLTPEQVLYYSPNCFGTADAIGIVDDVLYIFDLKTGITKADFRQLEIYAALFALEYTDVWSVLSHTVLRIYQSNDFREKILSIEDVEDTMQKIVHANQVVEGME